MRKLLAILLLLAVGYFAFVLFVPYGGTEVRSVQIRPGDSSFVIGSKLKDSHAVRSALAFALYHYTAGRGTTLKAGDYEFDRSETIADIHRQLARGEVAGRVVTIPEGFNMFDIADALASSGVATRDDFLNEARSDTKLIADLFPDATTLEGFLFPDTYRFSKSSNSQQIAGAMVKRFRQQAQAIGLLQRGSQIPELVTMASFVEKETAVPEERPLVAGVFYNRLRDHIALATDPSVIYASQLAGTWKGVIHQSELHSDSQYNTYSHAGLPPGPICNPGASAMQAAMNPAHTDYFYFVAGPNGHHRFARTLEEHNHNVNLYRHGK
ncbi:MAG: endolytic transglycosylase MltG [Acidobacteriales bacterium]|nr:endolytic transglycosylase MltG [Terriglobales bacterium]